MNKLIVCLTTGMLALAMVAGCGRSAPKTAVPVTQRFIGLATGETSGTYYPLGAALAGLLNKDVPGLNVSVQSSPGAVANIELLASGKAELAFVQSDIAYYATNGLEMYQGKPVTNLTGLASLYAETVQLVTLEASGFKTIGALKGRRIAVGPVGSGTEANARQILELHGITYKDIAVQNLPFKEAIAALRDGRADAAFVTAGYPTAAIFDIAAQKKLALLPLEPARLDALIAKYPFYTVATIPAGTYPGVDKAVVTVSVRALLVATDKVDAELGYKISKALYANPDRLHAAHAQGVNVTKATAQTGMTLPLNAGAEKFYQEK